jgi:phage tail protein X
MAKILLPLKGMGLFLVLLSFSFVPSLLNADEVLKILVRRGDTISYLSFKMYGMYDGQIAEILKKENPQVKDLDWIYVGQQLNFPAPEAVRGKLGEKTQSVLDGLLDLARQDESAEVRDAAYGALKALTTDSTNEERINE